jgi:hypothetical protein
MVAMVKASALVRPGCRAAIPSSEPAARSRPVCPPCSTQTGARSLDKGKVRTDADASAREVTMKGAAVLLCLLASGAPALALDVAKLPGTCQATLDTLKGDKARFAQYSGAMTRARKDKNNAEFCAAAKGTLALIVNESDQVDHCLGDLAVDKTATPDTVGQFVEVKNTFHKMLAAAKEAKNDRMHCGLAE